jgi:hypothetical protein
MPPPGSWYVNGRMTVENSVGGSNPSGRIRINSLRSSRRFDSPRGEVTDAFNTASNGAALAQAAGCGTAYDLLTPVGSPNAEAVKSLTTQPGRSVACASTIVGIEIRNISLPPNRLHHFSLLAKGQLAHPENRYIPNPILSLARNRVIGRACNHQVPRRCLEGHPTPFPLGPARRAACNRACEDLRAD